MAKVKKKLRHRTWFRITWIMLAVFFLVLLVLGLTVFLQVRNLVTSSPAPPGWLTEQYTVERTEYGGRTAYTVNPEGSGEAVLYFHGGAYKNQFYNAHWKLFAYLVDETDCTVVTLDYPLIGEGGTYREVFAAAEPLYRDLAETYTADCLTVMGDSSGGGIALALAEKMTAEGETPPARVILLSPWLDVSMVNPEISAIDTWDFFLSASGLLECGTAYAGGDGLENYLVSPLYGDVSRLRNVAVFTGTLDILNPDAALLRDKLDAAGVTCRYYEYENMFHVWMLADGLLFPQIRDARQKIAEELLRPLEESPAETGLSFFRRTRRCETPFRRAAGSIRAPFADAGNFYHNLIKFACIAGKVCYNKPYKQPE